MQSPDRLTIPACIGCGAMRKDQTCPVACAERRVDLVNAGDYDRLVASAVSGRTSSTGQVVPLVPAVLLMPPLPSGAPAVNSVDATLVLSGQPQSGIDVVTGGRGG